jgi:hypothetical protein
MVEAPDRTIIAEATSELLKHDARGANPKSPTNSTLALKDIHLCSTLFQPRFQSLMLQGRSNAHVKELLRVLRGEQALDPLLITSFGNRWYVVDGHHRFEAYRISKWKLPIPVEILVLKSRGEKRIEQAQLKSIELNAKDKLPMSGRDKADAAWMLTVIRPELSKREVHQITSISTSTVATMRKAKTALLNTPDWNVERLSRSVWLIIKLHYYRLLHPEETEELRGLFNEGHVKMAARHLSEIFKYGVKPRDFLEALNRTSIGYVDDLEGAIAEWRDFKLIENGDLGL